MAETVRVAFWNTELTRKGPGQLLRDLTLGTSTDIGNAVQTLDDLHADILVLGGFDYDAEGLALAELNRHLAEPFEFQTVLRPNSGIDSGFDLDHNGKLGEARDAMGFGWFPGQSGLAILSRYPFLPAESRDFSTFLWSNLPGADLPPYPQGAVEILRLSSVSHAETAVQLHSGRKVSLLTWHATTPAFDGPEDRNGRRNADENRFWTLLLNGDLPFSPPPAPVVLIGQANLDPEKGDGIKDPIQALLNDPRLQSPLSGDTVDYGPGIGPLRVAYILPSAGLAIRDSGYSQPHGSARHHPIWVEIDF